MISDVESQSKFVFQKDELGDKFALSRRLEQVLVRVVSFTDDFKVFHNRKEYLIFVGFWCKDLDFDYNYFTYSPETNSTISKGTMHEGNLLLDELKRIQNQ
jgi:hypothetical protein